MDAANGIAGKPGRLARILSSQRPVFILNRYTRGINMALSSEVPLNCILVQNFTAATPSRNPFAVTTRLERIGNAPALAA